MPVRVDTLDRMDADAREERFERALAHSRGAANLEQADRVAAAQNTPPPNTPPRRKPFWRRDR